MRPTLSDYLVLCHLPPDRKIRDHEWPFYVKFCFFAQVRLEFLRGYFESNCVNALKIIKADLQCQQQECSTWTLVSGDIRFKRIFAGVLKFL